MFYEDKHIEEEKLMERVVCPLCGNKIDKGGIYSICWSVKWRK